MKISNFNCSWLDATYTYCQTHCYINIKQNTENKYHILLSSQITFKYNIQKKLKIKKASDVSFLFFVVVITINNVDVTGLLVAALGPLGGLYEENEISDFGRDSADKGS